MLAAVHELVQRYNQHPSFAGLGIELSADSYALLPGELWGLDDETIHNFSMIPEFRYLAPDYTV